MPFNMAPGAEEFAAANPGGLYRPDHLGGSNILQFEQLSGKEKRRRKKHKQAFMEATARARAAGQTGRPSEESVQEVIDEQTPAPDGPPSAALSQEDINYLVKIGAAGIGIFIILKLFKGK